LEADEALVIVGARVDEVADGLLDAPLAWGEWLRCGFRGDGSELRFGAGDGGAEIGGEGVG